jgi:hypothetical protein
MLLKGKEKLKNRLIGSTAQRAIGLITRLVLHGPMIRWPDLIGSDSSMKTLCNPPLALFHTMGDMMTVILRIDGKSSSNRIPATNIVFDSLSDLGSMHIRPAAVTSGIRTVWHTGCLMYGCEGLRVLGTWIKPGWGLGITEIGRTGISNPHNNYRHIRQTLRRQFRKFRGE